MVGSLKIKCDNEQVGFNCPQCRRAYYLGDHALKELFAEFVPTHSKVVEACCNKSYAVSHTPCTHGCYTCDESEIHIIEIISSQSSRAADPVIALPDGSVN